MQNYIIKYLFCNSKSRFQNNNGINFSFFNYFGSSRADIRYLVGPNFKTQSNLPNFNIHVGPRCHNIILNNEYNVTGAIVYFLIKKI